MWIELVCAELGLGRATVLFPYAEVLCQSRITIVVIKNIRIYDWDRVGKIHVGQVTGGIQQIGH